MKKCPYCDFNSHGTDGGEFPEQFYIDALIRDLKFESPRIRGRCITSIFIGGGTPSLFSASSLDKLLSAVRSHLSLATDIEITLEANPGTLESKRFESYRELGINRISIGVQSFNDSMLKQLGRIHDAQTASNAIELAKSAGFDRINIDLMYGLPGQSRQQALDDLAQGIEHHTSHLSWYQLTIEPNTQFYKTPPVLPEDDTVFDIQQAGKALLTQHGFIQYEISAYALPGDHCKHNHNYWEFGDYLGIGAGAHGKITSSDEDAIYRYARHRIPERYMELAGQDNVIVEQKGLTENDLVLEFMMNNLRLTDGFNETLFFERTGLSLELIEDRINQAQLSGWLARNGTSIRPTSTGQNYLNDLLQTFL